MGFLQLLCRLREQVLRELGFRDIFKKVKVIIAHIFLSSVQTPRAIFSVERLYHYLAVKAQQSVWHFQLGDLVDKMEKR